MNYLNKRNENNILDDIFFRDFFDLPFEKRHSDLMKTDVYETDSHYSLSIELPGYSKDEINISLEDGYLTIQAQKDNSKDIEDNKGHFIRSERYFGCCSRSYYIGEIDEKSIKANYENGLLTLTYPKKEIEKISSKKQINIE